MIKTNDKRLDPIAMSYLRFSDIQQGGGHSTARQTGGADEWSEKKGIEIVKRMGDLGLSAWTGKHVKKGQLGAFLEMCKTEDFQAICKVRDVYLIVESLDRLSREMIMTAVNQLSEIVHAGVIVVTLCDGQEFTPETLNNPSTLIMAVTVMARANEESERKSDRIRKVYAQKRQDAIEGKLFSRNVPAWLELADPKAKPGDPAKFKQRPEVVRIIRRIFKEVASGKMPGVIARQFNKEGIPTLGDSRKNRKKEESGIWYESVIKRLLDHPAVGGTLRFGARWQSNIEVLDVDNYFPRIIDKKLQAMALRVKNAHVSNRGKASKAKWFLQLFRKIAFDWKTGEAIYVYRWKHPKGNDYMPRWSYVPKGVRLGKRKGKGWGGKTFEAIFFTAIRLALEVEGSTMRDEADLALAEVALEKIQKQINKIRDLFLSDEDDDLDLGIFRSKLVKLQAEEKELLTKVEEAKMKIQAGVGKAMIDFKETDREKLHQVLLSNVERIDMDCEDRKFRVKLMNGIGYTDLVNEDAGTYKVNSEDFRVDDRMRKLKV